jgi:hypothetical protein
MYNMRFSIQPQSSASPSIHVAPSSSTIVSLFLFLFFIVALIANLYKHQDSQKENELEAHRQMLERIWNDNANMGR